MYMVYLKHIKTQPQSVNNFTTSLQLFCNLMDYLLTTSQPCHNYLAILWVDTVNIIGNSATMSTQVHNLCALWSQGNCNLMAISQGCPNFATTPKFLYGNDNMEGKRRDPKHDLDLPPLPLNILLVQDIESKEQCSQLSKYQLAYSR